MFVSGGPLHAKSLCDGLRSAVDHVAFTAELHWSVRRLCHACHAAMAGVAPATRDGLGTAWGWRLPATAPTSRPRPWPAATGPLRWLSRGLLRPSRRKARPTPCAIESGTDVRVVSENGYDCREKTVIYGMCGACPVALGLSGTACEQTVYAQLNCDSTVDLRNLCSTHLHRRAG
jgi:hypothetical protein